MDKELHNDNRSGREKAFHVYCHIPFCQHRCPFCCFVSIYDRNDLLDLSLIPAYVKALVREIEFHVFPELPMQSLVFGGGTPTILDASQVEVVVEAVLKKTEHLRMNPFCMSFETTPELATVMKLEGFRKVGFNRVSIGVQSFLDEDLKILGRKSRRHDVFTSIEKVRSVGFNALNIDLLGGFPGSTFDKWRQNLETAFQIEPECITIQMMSCSYSGSEEYIEKMARMGYSIPSFNERAKMYEYAMTQMKEHGYGKATNSVFCKPGFQYHYDITSVGQTDKALCSFGPGVVSHLNGLIHMSFPFISDYIHQPLFKTVSCTYRENIYQLVHGQLIVYSAVRREVVEPVLKCTLEEAIDESPQAGGLVENLLSREYAVLDEDGLVLRPNKVAAGLLYLWTYQGKVCPM